MADNTRSYLDDNKNNTIYNYMSGFKAGPRFGKSILRPWNYVVEFQKSHIFDAILPHHVIDISIPTYKWKRETTWYGSIPKSFATFDQGQNLSFDITLEDDEVGSVSHLMYHIPQQHIMNEYGVYLPLEAQNLGNLWVTLMDQYGNNLCQWTMKHVYFLGTDDVTLSYANSDSMKVKFSFGCDTIEFATSTKSFEYVEGIKTASDYNKTVDRRSYSAGQLSTNDAYFNQ